MREAEQGQPEAEPLVSVCVATYNHADYLREAIASALNQTYERLEVVVTDDRSTDATQTVLQDAARDPRVRVLHNPNRLGPARNRNRAAAAAKGTIIKFLDDDDVLHPNCVAEMLARFSGNPEVGLVFGRQRVIAGDNDEETRLSWELKYGVLHDGFVDLREVTPGDALFRQWLAHGELKGNWIGGPTTVMVKRDLLARWGGFNHRIHQLVDSDLWLRLLPHTDVGFVDEALVSYRVGHARVSLTNSQSERQWLDRLWVLESLWQQQGTAERFPDIRPLLVAERRMAWRTVAKLGRGHNGRRVPAAAYLPYLRWRLGGSRREDRRRRLAVGST